ncbi:hypothetical protein CDL15_Pgr010461 [Punica granatum]|uniref:X8 domain-containing protein n=1 Tax=Punica granatum TaxID=22663 RepID=A0A218XVI2_PUNGR|nr:hypothetical protein CDL15_Pgr010461 [Punica granatum]
MASLPQTSAPMSLLLLLAFALLLHSAITKAASEPNGSWCIAKTEAEVTKLQAALDYACGHGADCAPIQPGAPCFEPNTIAAHASYAMNALYQHSEKKPTDCDFGGSAMLTSSDPRRLLLREALKHVSGHYLSNRASRFGWFMVVSTKKSSSSSRLGWCGEQELKCLKPREQQPLSA